VYVNTPWVRSEAEDAFCEAEPRLAKQGLHISVADMAQPNIEPTGEMLKYGIIQLQHKSE